MQIEIERKFLVTSDAWQEKSVRHVHLRDGLLAATGGRKVRIRIADDVATLTVKGARTGVSRAEFEYPIPLADAEEMLLRHCEGLVVRKIRHHVPEDGFTFEVDVYEDVLQGIVIAEAELAHIDQPFPRPAWLGEEITGREEYRKISMLRDRTGAGLVGS